MGTRRDLTLILLESAWTARFTGGDLPPQASAHPFLTALATYLPSQVISRQIRTGDDLRRWCAAMRGASLGTRVVWIGAHGAWEPGSGRKAVAFRPASGHRIAPLELRRQLARCGSVGVIVHACNFGVNDPDTWLPPNVRWALGFAESVDWLEALLYGIRTLTWLFDDTHGVPRDSNDAHARYRSGVRTGRYGCARYRCDYRAIATTLGAQFFWRERGAWRVCAPPDFA